MEIEVCQALHVRDDGSRADGLTGSCGSEKLERGWEVHGGVTGKITSSSGVYLETCHSGK